MEPKVVNPKALRVPLEGVEVFDRLTPIEYESLFLRTRCPLREIKQAYSECVKRKMLDRDTALRFALDPIGANDLDLNDWLIHSMMDGVIMLTTKDFEDGSEFVEDRPTLAILQLFLLEKERVDWSRVVESLCEPDTIVTISKIAKSFKLSRSTIQRWENGKRSDMKLITQKAEDSRDSLCRYGDIVPFLIRYFSNRPPRNIA